MSIKFLKLFTFIFIISNLIVFAQPITIDSTFGNKGIVLTSTGNGNDVANSVAFQNDGKIIVAGNNNNDIVLVRYNIDGKIDNTFGNNGIEVTNLGGSTDIGASLVILPDNKIIVGGYSGNYPKYYFALARFNSYGKLDSSFGENGKTITSIGTISDAGRSIALQSDGKIIVAGYSNSSSNSIFALIRYNDDGSLDSSFDSDGKVTTTIGIANSIIRTIAIQSDEKIIVSGYSYSKSSFDYEVVVARYNKNGSLDNSFGNGGIITTDNLNGNDYGESILIQKDKKILVAGYSFTGFVSLIRYNPNGSIDNAFSNNGKFSFQFGAIYQNDFSSTLQDDGKIIVCGFSNRNNTNSSFSMIRINTLGLIDNSFGIDGIVVTKIGIGNDVATSVILQKDGKIVLAGKSFNGKDYDIALVRYNNTMVSTDFNEKLSISKLLHISIRDRVLDVICNNNSIVTLQIIDLLGNVFFDQKFNKNIIVSNLKKGFFFLKISVGINCYFEKILI